MAAMQSAKNAVARAAIAAAGCYFRQFPHATGNEFLYNRIVQRYLAWRAFDVDVVTSFDAKMLVNTTDIIGNKICLFGTWEPVITRYIAAALKPGDIFIDVGANIGYYTLLAAKCVGGTGKVYSIEASPTIFRVLERNVLANRFVNVVLRNVAAVAEAGPIPIYLHDIDNLGHSTVMKNIAGPGFQLEATIEGRPLTEIVPRDALNKARFIKIDVEGAEWLVFRGLEISLKALSDQCEILMEIDGKSVAHLGGSIDGMISKLKDAGFSPFKITNSYKLKEYISANDDVIVPLTDLGFDGADIIFRRG